MYDIDYVKEHFDEFEEDTLFDRRFTKRFIEFLPLEEWEQYNFSYIGEGEYIQKEWTEENIVEVSDLKAAITMKPFEIRTLKIYF